MQKIILATLATAILTACGTAGGKTAGTQAAEAAELPAAVFDADSAYTYVERQVMFGPRVIGSEAHRKTAAWLEAELRRHGAEVTLQRTRLKGFDGADLDITNIIGQYNPQATDRLLLLAHWDCRPWADADSDESKHNTPVDGANDGASGVGVLLEIARQINADNPGTGIDILFVDAEDRGSHDYEDSWALGAQYFVSHPFREGYAPARAILLDMVGGRGARFYLEGFSMQGAPDLLQTLWATADAAGYGDRFPRQPGGAVTDDHVRLLQAGVPAVDIIEFDPNSENGFNATWHTSRDNMDNIDRETLKAVGQTVLNYIYDNKKQ